MKKLAIALLLAAIAGPASAQFDFRTTGTRTAQVWNFMPSMAVVAVSDPGWGKIMLAGSGSGLSIGNFYISQNGGPWTLLSSFVGAGAVTSVFGRTGAISANSGDYGAAQVSLSPSVNAQTTVQGSLGDLDTRITSNTSAIALKAPLASPTFTGTPAAPTAAAATNTTQIATTAFVQGEIASKAPLASPALTGTPTAPTAANGTSTTQVATTAFVGNVFTSARTVSALWTFSAALTVSSGDLTVSSGNVGFGGATGTQRLKAYGSIYSNGGNVLVDAGNYLDLNTGSTGASRYSINASGSALNFFAGSDTARASFASATGNLSLVGTITERGRTVPMGEWTAFTPSIAASSGTISGCATTTAVYTQVGKTMTVAVELGGCTVTGAPNYFTLTIPNGATSANTVRANGQAQNNGSNINVYAAVAGNQTVVYLSIGQFATGTWAASSANTIIAFEIIFPIV